MLHVHSVLLWGFNNFFLTMFRVVQQQLQVRVRAGLFVWLQCFVTCMQTAHLVTKLLEFPPNLALSRSWNQTQLLVKQ